MSELENIEKKRNKSRLWLVLLIALFVVPMIASWGLFFYTQKTGKVWGTSNKGILLSPMIALQDVDLELTNGKRLSLKDIETKWTLLYLMPSSCDDACQKDIFHMRQVHVSVSKDFSRVQRLVVLQDEKQVQTEKEFLQYYDDAMIALKDDENQPLLKQIKMPDHSKLSGEREGHIFIIDPQANVIMTYQKGFEPKNLFKDLKKLLRMSRIG